jgi:two-component system, NtrC family, sensor kinase
MTTQRVLRQASLVTSVALNGVVALFYYGLAEISRSLASTPNSVTPVWPPDGLAVGAVLLGGSGLLPGVFLGSFLANIQAFWSLKSVVAFLISFLGVLGIAAGTTLGTWLGTHLLRRSTGRWYPFERVADTSKFLVFTALLGPTVNATIGVAMLVFAQKVPWNAYASIWPVWWISNVAGIFILSPVILSWGQWFRLRSTQLPDQTSQKSWVQKASELVQERGIEGVSLAGFILLIGKSAFWSNYPLAYMLMPLLVWAAFRFGPTGATLSMCLMSVIAILGTVRGFGNFSQGDLNHSLMGLQSFIAVVVFTALILVAVLAERSQATHQLKQAFRQVQLSNLALEKHSLELANNNKQLELAFQELSRTQTQMIQSEKMSALGNMVAGVAHEINNPLGYLKNNLQPALNYIEDLFGLIDLYQERYPQTDTVIQDEIESIDLDFLRADLPNLIGSMRQGIDRMSTLSTSLRNFSRSDSDRPVWFDIHEGLDSTLLILQHRLKANDSRPAIRVTKHYAEIPSVECYAGQLNQVFMNILSNAIDALDEIDWQPTGSINNMATKMALESQSMPRTPEIMVSTELVEGSSGVEANPDIATFPGVKICLKDNANGIPEVLRAKIFDHLFTTKAVGKGTGLGLSIAHQIITEKHYGRIEVFSTPNQGSEFVIILPIQVPAVHPGSVQVKVA